MGVPSGETKNKKKKNKKQKQKPNPKQTEFPVTTGVAR
jgi:hypothetical protein